MKRFIAAISILFVLTPYVVLAQNSDRESKLSLTLTPPLFQVGIAPNTEWKSSLKLVNSNAYDIDIYARAVNFRPDGETGNAEFSPFAKSEQEDRHSLASWVILPQGSIHVPRNSTADISVIINVPENAEPGGHYAAIIVGTDPGEDAQMGSGFSVGTMITSLLFVRVPGAVVESGDIRDFYAEKSVTGKTEETFSLRFENTGNVHLLPQGNIVITNMWGKERGKIDINEKTAFGNVLPNTTRKFTFVWSGEENVFEAGRYKAVATLSYGDDGKKSAYRETYFWVIPWKPVAGTLAAILFFVLFMAYAVKRYVRKVLELERMRLGLSRDEYEALREYRNGSKKPPTVSSNQNVKSNIPFSAFAQPLKQELKGITGGKNDKVTFKLFIKRNQLAIAAIAVLILGIVGITMYFIAVFKQERSFHVETKKEGGQFILK